MVMVTTTGSAINEGNNYNGVASANLLEELLELLTGLVGVDRRRQAQRHLQRGVRAKHVTCRDTYQRWSAVRTPQNATGDLGGGWPYPSSRGWAVPRLR